MFSRDLYEIVHILGIAMLFAAMGGVAVHAANGGTRGASRTRALVASVHGIGAFLILLGGFGMLARLQMMSQPMPKWVMAKLVIWVLLSGLILLPYRSASLAKPFFIGLPFMAAVAAWLAIYKPIV
ncbi:MAG: hypothetical protein ACO1Q7_11475 [Gemmatimonas sp.]